MVARARRSSPTPTQESFAARNLRIRLLIIDSLKASPKSALGGVRTQSAFQSRIRVDFGGAYSNGLKASTRCETIPELTCSNLTRLHLMNRWHTMTGHGLLDMYRCETGPLDSDEGRRLKIIPG